MVDRKFLVGLLEPYRSAGGPTGMFASGISWEWHHSLAGEFAAAVAAGLLVRDGSLVEFTEAGWALAYEWETTGS
jgi:hypothetical protein